MLKTLLIENLVKPAAVRIGTLVSGGLIGVAVSSEHADAIGLGVASVLLIGCDFLLSWLRRRDIINKTFVATVEGYLNGKQL